MTGFILSLDSFIREMKVNRDSPHMLFLGAGASVDSRVKSTAACIQDWKREIFETRVRRLGRSEDEVQEWCDQQQGWPTRGSPEEYGFYVQECFPSPHARRRYFERMCRGSMPSLGYRLLALLAKAEVVK